MTCIAWRLKRQEETIWGTKHLFVLLLSLLLLSNPIRRPDITFVAAFVPCKNKQLIINFGSEREMERDRKWKYLVLPDQRRTIYVLYFVHIFVRNLNVTLFELLLAAAKTAIFWKNTFFMNNTQSDITYNVSMWMFLIRIFDAVQCQISSGFKWGGGGGWNIQIWIW